MKKHILCFGDSNTHGYCADNADCLDGGIRFTEEQRWARLLQNALGQDYLVIEEGLSGRTTCFDDPIHEGLNALDYIYPCLKSHEAIDLLKAKSRLSFSELTEDSTGLPGEEPEVEGVPAGQLQRFVQELPEGYRVVFNLYVMEGKSHREIAAMLGIREGTSASQLHKAKCALAEKIKKYRRDNQA